MISSLSNISHRLIWRKEENMVKNGSSDKSDKMKGIEQVVD